MTELYYNSTDTICAISTPPGSGGIAVVRLSGKDAFGIAAKVWRGKPLDKVATHTAHLGTIVDHSGNSVDQAVATVFRGPGSFTGEHTIEFSLHGSRWIQRRTLAVLTAAGARIALPGEFTRRAYAAGRLDLLQAEGVADLIASSSRAAHRAALNQMRGGVSERLEELRKKLIELASLLELELDFSDQDVEFVPRNKLIDTAAQIDAEINRLLASFSTGAAIKDGFPIVLMGPVNAGKSKLLNALLDDDIAIVSDIPGTTRDTVEDTIEAGDYLLRFIDTAGLRQTTDTIENIGIERTRRVAQKAAIRVYTVDLSAPETLQDILAATAGYPPQTIILALNKTDLGLNEQTTSLALRKAWTDAGRPEPTIVPISALNGKGIDKLLDAIVEKIEKQCHSAGDLLITCARHAEALQAARTSTRATIEALTDGIPVDLAAQHLRETIHHLSTITGAITTPQILNTIFQTFCIGK